MEKKHPAEIVAATLLRGVERRRIKALGDVHEGTPREEFQGIVYLWLDRHGFKRPQG
jgi:hypothetical protein